MLWIGRAMYYVSVLTHQLHVIRKGLSGACSSRKLFEIEALWDHFWLISRQILHMRKLGGMGHAPPFLNCNVLFN